MQQKFLGEEHPDVAFSINNLGRVLYKQGKYEEAEVLFQRALKIRRKSLGKEHPDTIRSKKSLQKLTEKSQLIL